MRDRLLASMRTIGEQPHGFFTTDVTMNIGTGAFAVGKNQAVAVSHLNAVFGLVEVCAELIQLLDVPEFRRAWLDYCYLYNATPGEQAARLGHALHGVALQQGHSRLTAYAARLTNDPALAARAWKEFRRDAGGQRSQGRFETQRIVGPEVLRPVDEAAFVSSNGTAQWGLAAIECLALIGDRLPAG
jgi:hypothetical protein